MARNVKGSNSEMITYFDHNLKTWVQAPRPNEYILDPESIAAKALILGRISAAPGSTSFSVVIPPPPPDCGANLHFAPAGDANPINATLEAEEAKRAPRSEKVPGASVRKVPGASV